MKNDKCLAVNGGAKAKINPYHTVRRFGDREIQCLQQALDQNTLFYGYGQKVKQACEMMKSYTGRPWVVPCGSGTAAIHLGLIACGIGMGDEVIVTPNTDSGSVIGIIAEGAVPVFCDCTDHLQPSAATVAARITERTRAVIVVHLAGYPAPVDEIVALCRSRQIGVVEDCAQAWGARLKGVQVGAFGTAGAFSTNDFKHLSTGDGGFVVLDDADLYRRVSNYSDKYYDRLFDNSMRQAHHGMNYRMSELQGAVAVAQLEKADTITSRYHAIGARFEQKLKDLPGGRMIQAIPGAYSTYWWSAIIIDQARIDGTRSELIQALQAEGLNVYSYGHYDLIKKRLFQEGVVRPWLTDQRRFYPFRQPDGRSYTYDYGPTPTHKWLLDNAIVLQVGGGYTDEDVDETAAGLHKVFGAFARS